MVEKSDFRDAAGTAALPGRAPGLDLGAWVGAARPATLTAAVAPVLVGTALAWRAGGAHAGAALAALLGAVFIQIGTNLVNDVEDFERGADGADRLGPRRVTQSGDIAPRTVRRAAILCFALASSCGLYLATAAGWPILLLGVFCLAAGIAYTAGPWPLAYHGLGDLFVFVFFGLAAVAGTYFAQTASLSAAALLGAVPVGALATAILVVNNLRDIDSDARAGKRTLAVRCGAKATRWEYTALAATAFATLPPLAIHLASAAPLLPLVAAPQAAKLCTRLFAARDAAAFNALLRDTARLHLAFAVLLALGIACASPR